MHAISQAGSYPRFVVRRVEWHDAQAALSAVRRTVFIEEQGVPEALEWEPDDAVAVHALATTEAGEPIGTGRLLSDGRIGRMAVLPSWRSHGVGSAILALLLHEARSAGYARLKLHAQMHALSFYARHGFVAVGQEFSEAGIPHREMVRLPGS